jgi:DNA-binding GntR family transcriptional regulator
MTSFVKKTASPSTLSEIPVLPRQSLHAAVADHLRKLIIEGVLAEGSRIMEAELCLQMNVSRTPLREALKVLSHEGLIELLPSRGARVSKVSAPEMRQLFEVISTLERLAAEMVTEKANPRDIRDLRKLHDRMAKHHLADQREDYFALNHQIHLRIVELSGNLVLVDTHAGLMIRARQFRYQALADNDRWNEAMAEHEAFMTAIENGESYRAGLLVKAHVVRTAEVVEQSILRLK